MPVRRLKSIFRIWRITTWQSTQSENRDALIQRKKQSVSWVYQIKERALKQLKKLDKTAATRIIRYLDERIASDQDPRRFGKELKGELKGIWRYRVGEYRILCDIQEDVCIVLVVWVDHRKSVYD